MRIRIIFGAFVAMLLVVGAVGLASAQGGTMLCNVVIGEGGRITLDCVPYAPPTELPPTATPEVTATPTEPAPTPTETATQPPSPLPTPTLQPTATAIPQPTPMPIDMTWHAPGIAHGDRPAHEHGDPVPQWVRDAGYNPVFGGMSSTPAENMLNYKHTAFKQWTGRFSGQDWFGVFHLDFQPSGRTSRFHGYQLYVRDATGAVSAITGWLDFGTGNSTGPQVVPICGNDTGTRPVMTPSRVGCPVQFESWYARAGGNGDWAPDFGFNINPNYYHGGDPVVPSTWTPTGGIRNLGRRIEFAWYLGGGGIRPALRGEFWATQWGNIISGPNDPVCGTQRVYGDRSYTVLCLRQYIAPTIQPMTFPGNAVQRLFPGDGVVLPN
jgi:hypothetical protein